jgi:hypothetical protein
VALDSTGRSRVWAHLMRAAPGGWPVTKPELRAAVDATDDWIEANQTSFNQALPQPFRGSASLIQKTMLFAYVAFRRAGLLRVTEDG